ncbi:MAG: hypothetical protein DRI89_09820 [Bacteroidetes bacterium]|nr:MAG: hypothetical protein DRI89_09820 [Bacteroidota bacterium]
MEKIKSNGNGNLKSMADMEGKVIEFPVTFELKTVMTGTDIDVENKGKLVAVFDKLKIKHKYRDKKISSKGTYTSYTFEVSLSNKETMDKLYEDLKNVEGLKFAL